MFCRAHRAPDLTKSIKFANRGIRKMGVSKGRRGRRQISAEEKAKIELAEQSTVILFDMPVLDIPYTMLILRVLNHGQPIPTDYLVLQAMRIGRILPSLRIRVLMLMTLDCLIREGYVHTEGDTRMRVWQATTHGIAAVQCGEIKRQPPTSVKAG